MGKKVKVRIGLNERGDRWEVERYQGAPDWFWHYVGSYATQEEATAVAMVVKENLEHPKKYEL